MLRAQSVPAARVEHRAGQPPIDFAREIQPIFKQDLRGMSRAVQSPRAPPAAHARRHPQRRPLWIADHARQERGQPACPSRDGPRRRGSDAARRRTAAGGNDRAPARVDRSRRADVGIAGARQRQPRAAPALPPIRSRTLVVRQAHASGAPRCRARGLGPECDRPLRAGSTRAREALAVAGGRRSQRCCGA